MLSNLRFVIYLFGGMVFAGMSFLYFDALHVRSDKTVWMRAIGSLFLSLSFTVACVMTPSLSSSSINYILETSRYLRMVGYIVLAFGVYGESLSRRPGAQLLAGQVAAVALPILPIIVAVGYLRRASLGLERHLVKLAYGMYVLALAEILDLRSLFSMSSDVWLFEKVRDFGPLWMIQLGCLFVGFVMVGQWVFGYLLKRFETQITMMMGVLVLLVFTVSTVVFTGVMAKQLTAMSQSQVANDSVVVESIWSRRGDELSKIADKYIALKIEDKEELKKRIEGEVAQVKVLDKDGRDILTKEMVPKMVEGVGYRIEGEGMARKIYLESRKNDSEGAVVVSTMIEMGDLEELSSQLNAVIRIYDDQTVIASSNVPGYLEIPSPLGLKRLNKGKLGGIDYISQDVKLKNAENVEVAILEVATPMVMMWGSISLMLVVVYGVGILTMILLQIPAMLIGRYITSQIK